MRYQFSKLYFYILAIAVLPIILSSCNANLNRQLTWHESELARAANSTTMPTSEKLDILMTSFVKMADETLKPINPKTGVKYVKKYTDMNQGHINKIMGDVQRWQSNMNELETITTGLTLIKKPYTKQLIELYPKFEKKYRQYKFALDLTNSISGGLGKLGGKLLKSL